MKGEAKDGIWDLTDGLLERLFPLDALPFDPAGILPQLRCKDGTPLHNGTRWKDWPGASKTEVAVANFYEMLADAVYEIIQKGMLAYLKTYIRVFEAIDLLVLPDIDRWHWSPEFHKSGVPDKDSERKPDTVQTKGSGAQSWRRIGSAHELKANIRAKLEAIFQLAGYSRLICKSQLDRRYVVGFALTGDEMTVVAFDRSGWVANKSFNIHKEPQKFLRTVIGHLFMDDANYGIDQTLRLRGEKRQIFVNKEWYDIVEIIHVESVLRGRATVCYHVRKDEKDYVVKDTWVDESRKEKESDILKRLNESANIEHVPRIIADEPVLHNNERDTTRFLRESAIAKNPKVLRNIEIREHRRMLIEPFAQRLEDFRTLIDLLVAMKDIAIGEHTKSTGKHELISNYLN